MTKRIGIPTALALWAGMLSTGAQAAAREPACLTTSEVSGLVLVIAPQAIEAVGTACAGVLPPSALIRQTTGPFIAKYRAEATAAWPQAKLAIGKLAGEEAAPFMQTDMIQSMMTTMFVPMITKEIKPKDCGKIDRIVTLLEPLPPRNASDLIATIIQMSSDDDRRKGKKVPLPICLAPQP